MSELQTILSIQDFGVEALGANHELREADSLENRLYDQMDDEQSAAYRLLRQSLQVDNLADAKDLARSALIHFGRAERYERLAEEHGQRLVSFAGIEASHELAIVRVTEDRRSAIQGARQTRLALRGRSVEPVDPSPAA